MTQWAYTDNIHDYIWIDKEKFRLNTAYDNIFQLFRNLERKPTYDAFFATIIFEKDYARFNQLTKTWNKDEFMALLNYIMREFISDDIKEHRKKVTDIYKDSELIFASFYYDYGISLIEKKGKMTWKEFVVLYGNLSPESPLGRAVSLVTTPDKDLTPDGRIEKRKRIKKLNEDTDIDSQFDELATLLKSTAKR